MLQHGGVSRATSSAPLSLAEVHHRHAHRDRSEGQRRLEEEHECRKAACVLLEQPRQPQTSNQISTKRKRQPITMPFAMWISMKRISFGEAQPPGDVRSSSNPRTFRFTI